MNTDIAQGSRRCLQVPRGKGTRAFAAATLVSIVALAFDVGAEERGAAVAYQINAAHNGVQAEGSLQVPFVRRWQVTLPGFISYPLIAQGKVFVTAGDPLDPVLRASTLYALDQSTGNTIWSQQLSHLSMGYPRANVAYDNGRIFAVGAAAKMSAYDAGTGTLLWTTTLPNQFLFTSAPTAANGVVYTGGAGSGGTVYAVDQTTGSVLATQPVDGGDNSSPTLSSTSVFVSYSCNQAYGFAQATLALRWHYIGPCFGGGGRTTVYENGRIYTRSGFGNLILDAVTGSLLGSYGRASAFFDTVAPALSGNTMWLLDRDTLSAQDVSAPSSPLTLWTFTGDGNLVTAPIVLSTPDGAFVVEGSSSGMLYALNAATGAQVWSTNIGTILGPPDEVTLNWPLTGLGAGQGLLVVPAQRTLTAFVVSAPGSALAAPVPVLSLWALCGLAAFLTALAYSLLRWRALGRAPRAWLRKR